MQCEEISLYSSDTSSAAVIIISVRIKACHTHSLVYVYRRHTQAEHNPRFSRGGCGLSSSKRFHSRDITRIKSIALHCIESISRRGRDSLVGKK